jgi:hypothetical protein
MRAFHKDRRESNIITKERPSTSGTRDSAISGTYGTSAQNGAAPTTQV